MGSNTFRVLPAPEALKHDVECFVLNEFNSQEGTSIKTFPNGLPGIVFHHRKGQPAIENIVTQSGHKFSPRTLFLYGPGTDSSLMNFGKGSYAVIQVILKPHALKPIFGINALILKDQAVELNEFSSVNINDQLINAHSNSERISLLMGFLLSKFNQRKARDELVEESLRLIQQATGNISVRALLESLALSERQFERRFSQTVGISPLSYIRIRRFNEVIRLMKMGQYDTLTEVAYALRYHDQAHFIRDIKSFTGTTPSSLLQ